MPDDPKEIVRRGYAAVSERYRADSDAPSEYETWLQALTSRLPASPQVLELGCGCGVPMARRLDELGHHVVGVDISAGQIARAPSSSRPTHLSSHFPPQLSTRSSACTC